MYVEKNGLYQTMISFLQILPKFLERGVEIRLINAKEPGPVFHQDFDRFPGFWEGLERVLCLRVHFKCIIIDGKSVLFRQCQPDRSRNGGKEREQTQF